MRSLCCSEDSLLKDSTASIVIRSCLKYSVFLSLALAAVLKATAITCRSSNKLSAAESAIATVIVIVVTYRLEHQQPPIAYSAPSLRLWHWEGFGPGSRTGVGSRRERSHRFAHRTFFHSLMFVAHPILPAHLPCRTLYLEPAYPPRTKFSLARDFCLRQLAPFPKVSPTLSNQLFL